MIDRAIKPLSGGLGSMGMQLSLHSIKYMRFMF